MPRAGKDYRWRKSSRGRGDASAVGEALEKLRKKNRGELTAKIVLKEASKRTSPLHASFDWNDTDAAEKYRLYQARNLIRDIEITVSEGKKVHHYVRIETAGRSAYIPTQDALEDAALRQQVLDRAWREAQLWADRYNHLAELADVIAVIRKGSKAA